MINDKYPKAYFNFDYKRYFNKTNLRKKMGMCLRMCAHRYMRIYENF